MPLTSRGSVAYADFFFFFQAEDGIRDLTVTGVQTCALPIWCHQASRIPQVRLVGAQDPVETVEIRGVQLARTQAADVHAVPGRAGDRAPVRDRKSTRLNSSHSQISYAVFCLKKKKKVQSRLR